MRRRGRKPAILRSFQTFAGRTGREKWRDRRKDRSKTLTSSEMARTCATVKRKFCGAVTIMNNGLSQRKCPTRSPPRRRRAPFLREGSRQTESHEQTRWSSRARRPLPAGCMGRVGGKHASRGSERGGPVSRERAGVSARPSSCQPLQENRRLPRQHAQARAPAGDSYTLANSG